MASLARQQAQVRAAIAAGARPRTTVAGATVLPVARGANGAGFVYLAQPDGTTTPLGSFYYRETGSRPPTKWLDLDQPLIREGPNDYVLLRNGLKRLVRTLQPNGKFHLTGLGKAFFQDKFTEYLAHVPVIIRGTRRRGRNAGLAYERPDMLPVTTLGLRQTRLNDSLSQQEILARIKQDVFSQGLAGPPFHDGQGNRIIMEMSEEVYYLDNSRDWVISSQSTQYINDEVRVDTLLNQRLARVRDISFQLFASHEILDEAFEPYMDDLCVPRQLSILLKLPLEEVCSDFDAIVDGTAWRTQGISPAEIREFCEWHNAPVFLLDPDGHVLDKFEPAVKEARALAYVAFNGHAYFYKSAKVITGGGLDETAMYRHERRETQQLPPIGEWKEWHPGQEPESGIFWTTTHLTTIRSQLLAAGHSPRVMLRSSVEYSALKLRIKKGQPCIIRGLPEEAEVLEQWLQKLPLNAPYRGQRMASLAHEVLMQLIKAERKQPDSEARKAVLEQQNSLCNLCGAEIQLGTCELDHIVPVHQAFSDDEQVLQALCLECHRNKTLLQTIQPTSLESRFNPRACEAYLWSPKLPPLVFEVHAPRKGVPCLGIDVVRCRKNGLANARFPLPIFCCLDDVKAAQPGHLADLTYVRLCIDRRATPYSQLPYVGEGWYAKPITAFMLDTGMATWDDFKYSLDATAHVTAECFRKALDTMEQAWPDGEEHYAKLSINALIGLWARNMDAVYTVRTSQNELDGYGCQERRVFSIFASDLQTVEERTEAVEKQIAAAEQKIDAKIEAEKIEAGEPQPPTAEPTEAEKMAERQRVEKKLEAAKRQMAEQPLAEYWDFVFIRNLMSNASHRPLHDFVLAAEYVAVARIKHQLRAALPSYIKCVKTDCVVVQQLPKKHLHLLQELQDLKHPDGSQVYRVEEVKPLRGHYREPQLPEHTMPPELEWTDIPDPLTHCLAGGSLLLTGLPGTGKTHLARHIVAALREQGQAVHIVAKTHCAVQNIGQGARTADHWLRRFVRHGNIRLIDWLVVEEITQLDTALWNDIACLALNTRVRFLLLGDFRQLPAVLDSFAGTEVLRELRQAQLINMLARGYRHELVENRRSDQGIFNFLRWLRIDEPGEVSLKCALQRAWAQFPERHDVVPDTALAISHRHRIRLNEWVNQVKAPDGATHFKYSPTDSAKNLTNKPQSMWIWPGIRLVGAGGKICKGTFVTVKTCRDAAVELEDGTELASDDLFKYTRLPHALTYAGCQGLTLAGHVVLCDTYSKHFTLRHLHMGSSRATRSDLLSVREW